jgi:type IX secretion system substrate protein
MKKILLSAAGIFCLFSPAFTQAQSFSTTADTVWATVSGVAAVHDNITNLTGSSLTLKWHVVSAANFPTDWLTYNAFGLCDNAYCQQNTSGNLWNGTTGNTFTSTYKSNAAHDSTDAFDLSLDLSAATSVGSHWVTVNIADANSSATKNITFVINKPPLSVSNVSNPASEILLYPNPARDELNIVYDANADVKNIAVYNVIGKVMTVFKVNGDSANLNLENIPSGIYFVRLFNSNGNVVVTKKFTKQ